jgi:TatA/E family protein of Tat protein translocase
MPQIGPAEILVVLVVALLVFGPKRLPEVGKQVGRGLRELRKIQDTVRDEINDVLHHDDEPPRYAGPAPMPVSTPARTSGRHAPSRFRAASTPELGAAAAVDTVDAPVSTGTAVAPAATPPGRTGSAGRPAHAPSRFRAPGR